ncbi:hypothetical protein [Metabacillus litoralis]|uniref:hypothetical protein n=1 Tax=Metabacillus litoralis TaxID=152268 RepID=UPI000EF56AF2|nr:hypothetical protein [Metabacillus litoralis]
MTTTKKKGFITIATGKEKYFLLARNLLYSYRKFTKNPLPFALITDRENEYTTEFDDVIIINDSSFNFMDKLKLYKYTPYDETIFIDADSLAYGDLNTYWEYFCDAGDFSCFGHFYEDINTNRGWFFNDGLGEYKDKISFIPSFNGGIYFFRKTPTCQSIFELANYFADSYSKYSFAMFDKPADEPVLALSMALHNCKPVDNYPQSKVFLPAIKKLSADIFNQEVTYRSHKENKKGTAILIHWANFNTTKALYKFEVEKLLIMYKGDKLTAIENILYTIKLRYFYYKILDCCKSSNIGLRKFFYYTKKTISRN